MKLTKSMTNDEVAECLYDKSYSKVVKCIQDLVCKKSSNHLFVISRSTKEGELVEFYGVIEASFLITDNSVFCFEKLGDKLVIIHNSDRNSVRFAPYRMSLVWDDIQIPGWSIKHNLASGEKFTVNEYVDGIYHCCEGLVVDVSEMMSKDIDWALLN